MKLPLYLEGVVWPEYTLSLGGDCGSPDRRFSSLELSEFVAIVPARELVSLMFARMLGESSGAQAKFYLQIQFRGSRLSVPNTCTVGESSPKLGLVSWRGWVVVGGWDGAVVPG